MSVVRRAHVRAGDRPIHGGLFDAPVRPATGAGHGKDATMKYMLLIYAEEVERDELTSTPEAQDAEMKRWVDYSTDLRDAGVLLAGDPLQRVATATTVRVRDGQRSVTDGPFAETKEVLGGYYLLDVDSVDDAITWAEQCPAAEYGSIELRPLMDFPAV